MHLNRSRMRMVLAAMLIGGVILAGSSLNTFAADEPNEAEVIGNFISETYNREWADMERSDWLTVEATLVGLSEDTTHVLCNDYALRGAAFFRGISSDNTIDRAGGWAVYETLDSSRNACYWAQGGSLS